MKNKILIPLVVIGILAGFFSFNSGARSSDSKRKIVLATVMKAVNADHFSPKALDDTFSARVFQKMIHDFDYDKLFFTQEDINKLSAYKYKIDDEIRDNSIEFFDTFDAMYVRRLASTEKYYQEMLQKPFSFNGNETIQLNADKMPYAANEHELAERWHQYLKYKELDKYVELEKEQEKKKENKDSVNVRLKTDSELEAEAREDTRKFYDRFFKRNHKMKDDERYLYYVNVITMTEDPHTEYFPPDEKKDFDVTMSGSFFGIGARLSPANDKITVSEIIPGSPSAKEGELKAGDEIIKVAQGSQPPVDIQGYELNDAIKLIRGAKGTEVRLTVKRPDGSTKVIPIVRNVINIDETFAKSAIIKSKDGPIGYINLPEFYADFNHTSGRSCAEDVAKEVQKLKDAGVSGIILDLRYNGGGSLGDVVDMAGIFIGKGPVVQVKGSHDGPYVLPSQLDAPLYTGPLAIMVNEGSASASEIMAAAMQDYRRAVIVGSMTYGKGTVQKMDDLDSKMDAMARMQFMNDTEGSPRGSLGAVKMTEEKFYRVNGGSTQLKGVRPDIALPDINDAMDDEDMGERHNKSALAWDEIPAAKYRTTNSTGDVQQLALMSQSRIQASPTFKLIQQDAEYIKNKRESNEVSLNEKKFREQQDEATAMSKKMDDLAKNATLLDMTNPQADMGTINEDTASINKNKDWLKRLSKDVYISETVNILNDMSKSGMKVNNVGTGMK